jgi:hypothetical protein
MTEHVWFCIKCGVIGEIKHRFKNYFDVLLAVNRDHVQVTAKLGSQCRSSSPSSSSTCAPPQRVPLHHLLINWLTLDGHFNDVIS